MDLWKGPLFFLSVLKLSSAIFVTAPDCLGRCYRPFNKAWSCQCNYACETHRDCCSDFISRCKLGGITVQSHQTTPSPKPYTPSHHVISSGNIADYLWQIDPDKFNLGDITLNIGGHTSSGQTTDVSHSKLFSHVNTAKLATPLYKALMALWDNYKPTRGVADPVTSAARTEINHFLQLVMASPVMDETYNYLTSHHIFSGDKMAFQDKLHALWFQPYSRTGGSAQDSSGFEHVFVGEYKSSGVEGFHNWVRLYKEELAGRLNYLGYMKQSGPQLLEFTFTWNGHHKKIDSCVIGSSPVFDLALGTICILTKPNSACPFSLNGYRFSIQQYDEAHTSGLQIATAYTQI